MRFSFFTTVSIAAISAIGANAVEFDDDNNSMTLQQELAQIASLGEQWELTEDQFAQLLSEVDLHTLNNLLENQYAQVDADAQSEASSKKKSSSGSGSSSSSSSSSDNDAQIGADSDDDDYGLAQINAEIEAEEALLAQIKAEIESESESESGSEASGKSSSSSSSSSGSGSSSSSGNNEAQVAAENEDGLYSDYENDLAQINADIEAEALAAEQEEAMGIFKNFLAQIGIEESEELLAQLGQVTSDDTIGTMAMSPEIYMGLAQIASDYHQRAEAVQNVLAQVGSLEEPEMAELGEMMAQMNTEELEDFHQILAQMASEEEW